MSTNASPAGGRGAIVGAFAAYRAQSIPVQIIPSFWYANKSFGFDCPGCAFPDKAGTPLLDSCEQGQKAIAWEMTRRRTDAAFFAGKTPAQLRTLSDFELENAGRLATPILYQRLTNQFSAISWETAYAVIAESLKKLSPDEVAFYASGRSSNEAAFLWQLMARSFGSPHLPDSSNFCHEPSGYALKQVIGVGKGTCSLDDFEHAELIIVLGQNPASNHPRMMAALYEARKRGAKILVLNPLRERGYTEFSDPKNIAELISNHGITVANEIYQVQIGGDLAALQGALKALFELELQTPIFDQAFVSEHTIGIAELKRASENADWRELETHSGLSERQMRDIAQAYAKSNATMITWCMGITHHPHAVATIQYIINLLLLKGNIGKKGAGAIPMRGHSNVQGDRTMGATSTVSTQWLNNLENHFTGLQLSRANGRDAIGVINGLFDGSIKAMFSLGGNFGVAAPDSPRVLQALSQSKLTVHIATKLNRTHCYPGEIGLILPTLGRTDLDHRKNQLQFISTEDSMSNVRASHGVQQPIDATMQLSEPAIVATLASTIKAQSDSIPWLDMADDYALIRHHIEHCQRGINDDFEHYQQKLLEHGRFNLENAATKRRWKTSSQKAEFRVHALPYNTAVMQARKRHGAQVLCLMTLRSHDQFNTTVYSNDDRYRGIVGDRRVIFMHPDDIQARQLNAGDKVDITAVYNDGITREVTDFSIVRYDIPHGCAAAYFPEASALVASSEYSAETKTPAYKEIPVFVRQHKTS